MKVHGGCRLIHDVNLYPQHMHGIYMVYTWYIHGIFHPYGVLIHMYGIYHVKHLWVCSVPFFILIYM